MGNPSSDTFILACPTVPVVRGLEVRFSIEETYRAMSLSHWPLAYIACGEITPPQPLRSQWGVPTAGARYDSFGGVRLGSDRTNLVLGSRSTYASNEGRIGLVERQRVGIATLTLGGRVSFKYWNDHAFWWWPIGGTPVSLMLYFEDCDAVTARAVASGATVLRPVQDQFYGDRSGTVLDPFGHKWTIATHKEDLSPAELQKRAAALFGQK